MPWSSLLNFIQIGHCVDTNMWFEMSSPLSTPLFCIEEIGMLLIYKFLKHIVKYQDSPVTQQLNGASLLYIPSLAQQ
jgi:hypothetical protein